jgi:hypothetical protein
VITLVAALQVFLKVKPIPFTCLCRLYRSLPSGWYLRQERLFRRLYDEVRVKEGATDFSMDTRPFRKAVGRVMQVTVSRTLLLFCGPVLA